jgi:protein-tyrosine phosphatase
MVASAEDVSPDGADRWISLDGAANVRDLGGLPVLAGGQTRFGRLLRAGTLQELTDDAVAHLVDDIGLRTVVDLRLADEALREGSMLSERPGVRYLSLPLWSADRIRVDVVADASKTDVVDHYVAFLEGSDATIVGAAREFTVDANLPAVFHCAAGKDRTGVLAAVLLDAVGVTSEAIVADYALSGERLEQIQAQLVRLDTYRKMRAVAATRPGALTADPSSMQRFLAVLSEKYGGGAGYLRTHGLAEDELVELRHQLVDATAA